MSNFKKIFAAVAVVMLALSSPVAFAQGGDKAVVEAAKAAGTVGEQADGYLGFVSGSADAATTAAVNDINNGRRSVYAQTAAKSGVTPEAAGQATGAQLIGRTPVGQFVKPLDSGWSRK
jgi:uncharacterized protein YdbL (DUF1318 family)